MTEPRLFGSVADLLAAVGEALGHSDWLTMEQERIDAFAAATEDRQWIHTDPERAADGPFGATIAHGLLTLAMVPRLVGEIYRVPAARMAINYGCDRVRFIRPVRVGSRIRAQSTLKSVAEVGSGAQVTIVTTVGIDGEDAPAALVEHITRYLF